MYWNCQGIRSKSQELLCYLRNNNVDIICLCETFLKPGNRFDLPGYTCVRNDRLSGRLGGLMILIKIGLKHNIINSPTTNLIECQGIEVIGDSDTKLLIFNVYLPGGSSDSLINQHFSRDIETLTNCNNAYVIAGDFNARHMNWNCTSNNVAGNLLSQLHHNNNFFIEFPDSHTYCPMSPLMSHSTIDLILTNRKFDITNIKSNQLFSSDHLPVTCTIDINTDFCRVIRFNYKNADWNKFRQLLDNDLERLLAQPIQSAQDINDLITRFTDSVGRAEAEAVPLAFNGTDNIFIDPGTKLLIQMRNFYRRRFLRYFDPIDNTICVAFKKQINLNLYKLKNQRWETKLKDCSNDHTAIFKLAKSFKRKNTGIPVLEGAVADKDKANLIARTFNINHINPLKNFNSLHSKKVDKEVNIFVNKTYTPVNDIISYTETAQIIKNLKPNKAPGSDGITAKVIKNLPNRGIFFLTHIYNYCLFFNFFPDSWKNAKVFPLLKPGKDPTVAQSYRPISLLSIVGKIFERVLLSRIQLHIDEFNIIPDTQFGFRNGHSTDLQLLRLINHVKANLNLGNSTGFLSLDCEKAFDRVWHNGLISKMIHYKFPYHLTNIVASFLKGRTFFVNIGLSSSDPNNMEFGVPQGSVLSPSLYNIYISDIPTSTNCHLGNFADDTGIYTSGKYYKGIRSRLQKTANELNSYFRKWKISMNEGKTEAIFFTRRLRKQKPVASDSIKVGNQDIQWSDSIKYLGCHLDTRLTLKTHINSRIQNSVVALKTLYPLINRNSTLSRRIKTNMFKTYFRPILTYPNIVLNTVADSHLKSLQIQQNKFLRLLNSKPRHYRISRLHKISKTPYINEYLAKAVTRAKCKCEASSNRYVQNIYCN